MKKRKIFISIFLILFFFISFWIYKINGKPVSIETVFPNKPWAKTIEHLPDLKGVGKPHAENCGKCHTEIYKEWRESTHAHALSDLQFQSEIHKESSPKWLCLNCHIPISNQREFLVNFLKDGNYKKPVLTQNPYFDPILQQEAITCATCHVRVNEKGESYVLGANGETDPPHPIKIQKQELNNICQRCHQETHNLSAELVCAFGTGSEMEEWKKNFIERKETNCATCHLPETFRSFVNTKMRKPKRKAHVHGFIGGGVPKEFSLYNAQIPNGYKLGLEILEIKKEENQVNIQIKNAKAGHYVPTGDPERFLQLEWNWLDKEKNKIEQVQEEIGQKWEWYPVAKKVSDNRIKPDEIVNYKKEIPKNTQFLQFRIRHVRLKKEVAEYMKKNSNKISEESIRKKISELTEHYPLDSVIWETQLDFKKNIREDIPLFQLMQENKKKK